MKTTRARTCVHLAALGVYDFWTVPLNSNSPLYILYFPAARPPPLYLYLD